MLDYWLPLCLVLLVPLFETFPLECPRCGGEIRLVAFVTDAAVIRRLLPQIGEPIQAPVVKPALAPPDWGLEPGPGLGWEGQVAPEPECELAPKPARRGPTSKSNRGQVVGRTED